MRAELVAVLALTLLGVIIKLLHLDASTSGDWSRLLFFDETHHFLAGARCLADEGWKFFASERSLWTGPVPVMWLLAFGLNVAAVKVANVLLLAGAGLLAWDLARRRFGRSAGLAALGLCTVHLPLLDLGPTLLSEPPFTFLVTLAVWLAYLGWERPLPVLAAGGLTGLATLTRPALQLWPIMLAAMVVIGFACSRNRNGARPVHLRAGLTLLSGFLLVVGPYITKNAIVLDRPVIANGLGAVLYLGTDLRRGGDEPIHSGFEFDTGAITAPFAHLDSEGDRRLRDRALERVREHPGAVARLTARKAVRMAIGSPSAYFHPHRDIVQTIGERGWKVAARALLAILTTTGVTMLGVLALLLWGRGPLALLCGSLVGYMWLVHTLLFPLPRFMVPVFPLLTVWAGASLARLVTPRGASRRESRLLVAACAAAAVTTAAVSFWHTGRPPALVPPRTVTYFKKVCTAELASASLHHLESTPQGLAPTGPDPHLDLPLPQCEVHRNTAAFLNLSVSHTDGDDGPARLTWTGGGSSSEGATLAFEVVRDGNAHTYRVVLGQTGVGTAHRLRLDLPAGGRGTTYRLLDLHLAE